MQTLRCANRITALYEAGPRLHIAMDIASKYKNSSPMNIAYATKYIGRTAMNIADEMQGQYLP